MSITIPGNGIRTVGNPASGESRGGMLRRRFFSTLLINSAVGATASVMSESFRMLRVDHINNTVLGSCHLHRLTEEQRALNSDFLRRVASGTVNIDDLSKVETGSANFYGWFIPHCSSVMGFSLDLFRSIEQREGRVVLAPETVFTGLSSNHPALLPDKTVSMLAEFLIENNPLLSFELAKYALEQRIPVLVSDLLLTENAGENFLRMADAERPDTPSEYMKSMGMGLAAALPLSGSALISRRAVMIGSALTAAAGFAAPMKLNRFKPSPYYDWDVGFRNALMAAKILRLADLSMEKGEKLTFVLSMGSGHRGIMDNFRKGLDHNLRLLEKYRQIAVSELGPYWDKGYLYDGFGRTKLPAYLEVGIY